VKAPKSTHRTLKAERLSYFPATTVFLFASCVILFLLFFPRALHWAVDRNHLEAAQTLLESKADPNIQVCCFSVCFAGLSDLILNQDETGQTPLHYACTCDHEKLVSLLIRFQADPQIKDKDGELPSDCTSSDNIVALLNSKKK
jgi:ankyrin repeat protein